MATIRRFARARCAPLPVWRRAAPHQRSPSLIFRRGRGRAACLGHSGAGFYYRLSCGQRHCSSRLYSSRDPDSQAPKEVWDHRSVEHRHISCMAVSGAGPRG